jgi:16S rRNA (adenine1518-N6/adenine1519-N6)-dimethyltransferase
MSDAPHRPRKRFGQNFLHDPNVIDKIVHAIDPKPGEALVEIGPGQGALTYRLLQAAGALTAIELDRDLIAPLRDNAAAHGALELIEGDCLKVDFAALAQARGRPLRVVGNLPYYISTPIVFHLLESIEHIGDLHFMLQLEVVERMAAEPGSKTYGRLSVMVQDQCEVALKFRVPPGAFFPAPKVTSAIVALKPRLDRSSENRERFEAVVRHAFGQRRKTLSNALKPLMSAVEIDRAGVDPQARAETLSVAQFRALAA